MPLVDLGHNSPWLHFFGTPHTELKLKRTRKSYHFCSLLCTSTTRGSERETDSYLLPSALLLLFLCPCLLWRPRIFFISQRYDLGRQNTDFSLTSLLWQLWTLGATEMRWIIIASALAPCGCHHTWLQTQWLKTTQVCLTVVEVSEVQTGQQDGLSSGGSLGECVSWPPPGSRGPLSSLPCGPAFLWYASLLTSPSLPLTFLPQS